MNVEEEIQNSISQLSIKVRFDKKINANIDLKGTR